MLVRKYQSLPPSLSHAETEIDKWRAETGARRNPDGCVEVVARDPRIIWPDGIYATDTHVYCTLGQWNRLAGFNGGKDLRRPPYLLIRAPIEWAPPVEEKP
jgi:hypothetical protein